MSLFDNSLLAEEQVDYHAELKNRADSLSRRLGWALRDIGIDVLEAVRPSPYGAHIEIILNHHDTEKMVNRLEDLALERHN